MGYYLTGLQTRFFLSTLRLQDWQRYFPDLLVYFFLVFLSKSQRVLLI